MSGVTLISAVNWISPFQRLRTGNFSVVVADFAKGNLLPCWLCVCWVGFAAWRTGGVLQTNAIAATASADHVIIDAMVPALPAKF
jgi:hypothetical protein